ncbi:hypothetical protein BKA04_000808 [Cryobacterium mesophilum]|uniref:Uncharacterized protein n=1 Tax=Terrimesophilobacter mesophilus TaxID=433647 RepID=A0A4R8V8D5_9MICO|nr:hypothetical protein [Terrimesophilobacter mesophilus]MBB5632585.1 hypothetical protein [Terrimesophilobacter mesophilus]TFB79401.1 hypothetical protein E3N84_04645 [Terrimesophilobacter mesophilus]
MAADPDEEALSWSGETDPTHVGAPSAANATAAPALGGEARPGSSSLLLVVFGILAGIYLLYAIGWGIHAFAHSVPVAGIFPVIMYQLGEFFSIASPFLWAGAVWLLVKRPAWRLLWLFVGVLLLAPWPFIVGG